MGRRLTPSVGRLTVTRVIAVGVVKSQDAWSDRSIKETPMQNNFYMYVYAETKSCTSLKMVGMIDHDL